MKKLFRRTVDTGIEHGTVTVLAWKRQVMKLRHTELTGRMKTAAIRRRLLFTNRLEEDLRRSDFTINAMAYNDEVRLSRCIRRNEGFKPSFDPLCGRSGENVFTEDALRILRAVRFSAQLGFPDRRADGGGGQGT